MPENRKRDNHRGLLWLILLVLAGLAVLITFLLRGNNVALFNPKGLIAEEQLGLTVLVIGIMLLIAIPAIFLFYFTAWKYRESNDKAKRDPDAGHGTLLNWSMWGIPFVFMLVLAGIMWSATHRLEPQKQIASNVELLTIQVVAQRWKWIFIYPEQQIATVNYVQIPVNTPVTFELTADEAPMSAFWIPNLGGMLYAMTGHVNRLNLMAETPGEYPGSTAEINGAGFAGMRFTAAASSKEEFDAWVRYISLSSDILDGAEYGRLLKPSEDNLPAFYSLTDANLYAKVLMKYMGGGHNHQTSSHDGERH